MAYSPVGNWVTEMGSEGTDPFLIEGLKVLLPAEQNIRGILDLHHTPMVGVWKMADHRAVWAGGLIQDTGQLFDMEVVGQSLGLVHIVKGQEGIVLPSIIYGLAVELGGPLLMTIEIELQTKRGPGRHPQITPAQGGVDKVEVVMQALAAIVFQKGPAGFLVVPGFVAGAGFQGREDMHQAGMAAAPVEDLLDTLLFAEVFFADEIDFPTVGLREAFGMLSQFLPQRHGPLGVIENANIPLPQNRSHPFGITDTGNGEVLYR